MLAAATVLIAQAASVTAPYATWNGITLGAPASTLRPVLGDPLRILPFENDTARVARYWLAGSNSTYVLTLERNGYITGYHIFTETAPVGVIDTVAADPLGVRLGDTMDSVRSKTPQLHADVGQDGAPERIGRVSPTIAAAYSFENGRVQAIHWTTKLPAGIPALPPLTAPSGESVSSAILDKQQNETDGVAWESRYLAFHPCADNARWQLQSQSLLHDGARAYDQLHVVCAPTKSERDYYFDVSNYFGKM